VVVPGPSGARRYVRPYEGRPCHAAYRLYEAGEELPAESSVYRKDPVSGACTQSSRPSTTALRVARDAPAAAVVLRARLGAAAGNLQAILLESEDGAQDFYGWKNVSLDASCVFPISLETHFTVPRQYVTADGVWRCLPEKNEGKGEWFADPDCSRTQPAGSEERPVCSGWVHRPRSRLTYSEPRGTCIYSVSVDFAGDRIARVSGRETERAPCTEMSVGMIEYFTWKPAPVETFPVGRVSGPSGRGRIQPIWLETHAGRVVSRYWDRKLQVECFAGLAADGSRRCIPKRPWAFNTASSCGKDLLFWFDEREGCRAPAVRYFSTNDEARAEMPLKVFEVKPWDAQEVGATCPPRGSAPGQMTTLNYLKVVREVQPGELALLTE
jgi:hypothetical protein